ncbi:MAG: hypothetical protein KKD59_08310, partial [Acidobacteria bacterium]|nr:hypothetical protein [Acidobacteriota bacterium]
FTCLEGNTASGDVLWKNGEAILTEIMVSRDNRIWNPALNKALEFLSNDKKREYWENVSESLNIVKIEDNPELVDIVVTFIGDPSNDIQARTWLAKKVIPEILARPIEVGDVQEKQKIEDIRSEHIRSLLEEFKIARHHDLRKALAYALGTAGDIRIKDDLMEQLKINKDMQTQGAVSLNQTSAFEALFGRRSDIIKILGMLKYDSYPTELRDELIWFVLSGKIDGPPIPAKAMGRAEAACEVAAQTLIDLSEFNKCRPEIKQDVDVNLAGLLNCPARARDIKEKIISLIEDRGSISALKEMISSIHKLSGPRRKPIHTQA